MVKTEVMAESADKQLSKKVDMSKPVQQLFDECLNFISLSSFDI